MKQNNMHGRRIFHTKSEDEAKAKEEEMKLKGRKVDPIRTIKTMSGTFYEVVYWIV